MSTALYRRYRPETFADVIGQEHVTDPLRAALRADRITHAYLFSGPRGCGKTTSARIFARCLNCAEGPTDTPCGTCPSCLELARDGAGSLDVVEMDAASHGGVDDARELRERAAFAPARDRYKIFIIDEAHMVTSQGFNALLKLVEEPPAHVKFVFATTEPEKVIGTIRSRTHHYPFRLVPPERLQTYLEELCVAEGVSVETGVLPLVVRAGGGSVRDSLSVLDQLIAGAQDGEVSYERAVSLLGYTHATLLDDVVDALAARDGASLFRVVDRVIDSGHDPRRFAEDLLERIRDLVVIAVSGEHAVAVLRSLPKDQFERMRLQSQQLGPAELSRAGDLVNDALTEMSGATSPRLQLELMCARLLLPGADDATRGHAARLDRIERHLAGGGGVPAAAASASATGPAAGVGGRAAGPPVGSGGRAADPAGSAVGHAPGRPGGEVALSSAGPGGETGAAGAAAPAGTAARAARPRREEPAAARGPADGPADRDTPGTPSGEPPGERPAAPARPTAPPAEPPGVRDASAGQGEGGRRDAPAQAATAGSGSSTGQEPRSRDVTEHTATADAAPARHESVGASTQSSAAREPAARPAAGTEPAARPAAETEQPARPAAGAATREQQAAPTSAWDRHAAAPAAAPPAQQPGPAPAAQPGRAQAGADADLVRRRWPEVLSTLAGFKRVTWALVSQNAHPGEVSGGVLHLAFSTGGLAHTFRTGTHAEALQRALLETLGVQLRIEPVLSQAAEGGDQGAMPYASGGWGATPSSSPAPEPGWSAGGPGGSSTGGAWGVTGEAPAPGPAEPSTSGPSRSGPPSSSTNADPRGGGPSAPPSSGPRASTSGPAPSAPAGAAPQAPGAADPPAPPDADPYAPQDSDPYAPAEPDPFAEPGPGPEGRGPATAGAAKAGSGDPQSATPASGAPWRQDGGRGGAAPAPRTGGSPASAATPASTAPVARISLADDTPSMDDPDAENSGLVGAPLIERMLGGTIISED